MTATPTLRTIATVVALSTGLLALGACSSSNGESNDAATSTTVTESESTEAVSTDSVPASDDDETADADVPLAGPVPFPNLGPPTIRLLTPETDNGIRPELAWEAVEDAASYELTLIGPGGGVYWAWSGEAASIPVGGEPLLGPNSAGAALADGMIWYVVAIDAEGFAIAQSAATPIAP